MSFLSSPELHILVSYVDIRPNKEMGAIHDPWQLIQTTCKLSFYYCGRRPYEFPGYQLVKDVADVGLNCGETQLELVLKLWFVLPRAEGISDYSFLSYSDDCWIVSYSYFWRWQYNYYSTLYGIVRIYAVKYAFKPGRLIIWHRLQKRRLL